MYTFPDRRGRSLTLRPEGTAGVVRGLIERKHFQTEKISKWYYLGPMFRYERPQKGRERQFNQIGLEFFGSPHPGADAEVITLSTRYLEALGFSGVKTRINSIGCRGCRSGYLAILRERLKETMEALCVDCTKRAEFNPMRVFDCKNETCAEVLSRMPAVSDHLCEKCVTHFGEVQQYLDATGITFEQDNMLVRGFDYYTRTVFETTLPGLGAQDAVLGGGRYDNLVEDLGGTDTPAVGMSFGLERIILAMEANKISLHEESRCAFFVIAMEEDSIPFTAQVAELLRSNGAVAAFDYSPRSIKSGLRAAGKSNFTHGVIIGQNETENKTIQIKDLETGEQQEVPVAQLSDFSQNLLTK